MRDFLKTAFLLLFVYYLNISQGIGQSNFIDHKLNIGIRVGVNSGIGSNTHVSENFITPSLLNYMQSGFTGEIFAELKLLPYAGVNAGVTATNFSEWKGPENNNIYDGSSCEFIGFRPGISFFTPFKKSGLLNKANLILSVGPIFSQLTMNYGDVFQPKPTTNTNSNGLFAITSMNYSLSQSLFITLAYSINNLRSTSELSIQENYQYHNFNVGIGIQLLKNKKYLYD